MAEGVGHGSGHRSAGRGGKVGVHRPELDPVSLAMKAPQVGADGGAAVEAQLADALGELAHEQVVPVELSRGQAQVDVLVLVVDGENPPAGIAAPGHLRERLPRRVLRGGRRGGAEQQGGDEGQGREVDTAHGGVEGKDGAALNSNGWCRLCARESGSAWQKSPWPRKKREEPVCLTQAYLASTFRGL